MPKQEYGADSLTVLEGLDAVRKRPGMYIGTTDSQGLMHCLWEIIDNAVDEALAGACDHITVTLHDDGSVEVADNGRGIPVDVEPKTKLTGVEVVLTKLHAGAKFGNASYNAAGGLHGVGSSVVNALSSRLDVEVDRDGKTHHMAFHQGHPGVYSDTDPEHPSPDAPFKRTRKNRPTELEIIGKVSPKTTGTRIRYWADPEIFNDTAEFSYEQLIDRVRQTSFLVPGLRITVIDENVPETGDDSVDEMMEVDAAQTPADDGTGLMDVADIASAADTAVEDTVEAGEAEARPAAVSAAVETAKVDAARHTHARVEEFRHTGGVKDFVDFLSGGSRRYPTSGASPARTTTRRRPRRSAVGRRTARPESHPANAASTSRCGGPTGTTRRCAASSTWSRRPAAACTSTVSSWGSPSRSARPLKTTPANSR